MKKMVMIGLAVLVMFGLAGNDFAAAKRGTAAEAEKMVKKAIAMAKAKGNDAAFAEINNKNGQFTDRDLYVFVYDMGGKVAAHGLNPKMIVGAHRYEGRDGKESRQEASDSEDQGQRLAGLQVHRPDHQDDRA
jgi:hypothetical protein